MSNADWHRVGISVNDSHIALAADAEQTIHPISDGEQVHTGFNMTHIGGATSNLGFLNKQDYPFFTGCMQDIQINGENLVPGADHSYVDVIWQSVDYKCKRRDQCNPNPCENGGKCRVWDRNIFYNLKIQLVV